ncbi:Uncharacterised protein [Mycobacteroides abscessus subsp. abscessus]|nr:Uncharacterised protein [Mycobacteroides abscessus subsp. abscessus]
MVVVLVRGEDRARSAVEFVEHTADGVRVVGGVDDQLVSGRGTGDDVDVVVHGPDRDLHDRGVAQRAALRAGLGQIAGVIVGDGEVGRSHELSVATQVDGADEDGNTWWAAYR